MRNNESVYMSFALHIDISPHLPYRHLSPLAREGGGSVIQCVRFEKPTPKKNVTPISEQFQHFVEGFR